jgi:membrane protein implicated in regulation of membrane protease activity
MATWIPALIDWLGYLTILFKLLTALLSFVVAAVLARRRFRRRRPVRRRR